jgi:hypothetical protein
MKPAEVVPGGTKSDVIFVVCDAWLRDLALD